MINIKTPFFIFNPKSHLYGEELLELARVGERLAASIDETIFLTVPFPEISKISNECEYLAVCAQHMDALEPGRGMGYVFAESLKSAGVKATFLNHAEHPMTLDHLSQAIKRAKIVGLRTIVCANSVEEARSIALLKPDIILCEPTELISTGQTSDAAYIEETNQAIRAIDSEILVMQAAGISTAEDVYRVIQAGADGTGCTSGIVKADNPVQMFEDMVKAARQASEEGD